MDPFSIDAYRPEEIASRIQKLGVVKSNGDPWRVLALSLLAGAFIALGAALFTIVTHDAAQLAAGVLRLIGGLAFCLGLVLVVVAGAELFTGNNLIVMAWASGKVTTMELLRNWIIVYVGNFVGSFLTAYMIFLSKQYEFGFGAVALDGTEWINEKPQPSCWIKTGRSMRTSGV